MEGQNPYTTIKGYKLYDASGREVGRVQQTVYDAPSDVLKYVVVNRHTVPADRIEVDVETERVWVPYERETVESAPTPEDPSGEFDRALRAHYKEGE